MPTFNLKQNDAACRLAGQLFLGASQGAKNIKKVCKYAVLLSDVWYWLILIHTIFEVIEILCLDLFGVFCAHCLSFFWMFALCISQYVLHLQLLLF